MNEAHSTDQRVDCPNCHSRFSDWFTWGEGGFRHCFLCWLKSGYRWTWLETGERIET